MGGFVDKVVDKQLIGKYGRYSAYSVNGEALRNYSRSSEEFGEANIHEFIPEIPKYEIWIDDGIKSKDELRILISTNLFLLKKLAAGLSKDEAYDLAMRYERSIRQQSKSTSPTPTVYTTNYGRWRTMEVWIVDPKAVKDNYPKVDWMQGGNPAVYSWMPENEFWLEYNPHEEEYPYTLLHEISEYLIMKTWNYSYHKAHDIADRIEFYFRSKNQTLTKRDVLDAGPTYLLRLATKLA